MKDDHCVYDTDPDAIVLKTIEAYMCGHAERSDVAAAVQLTAVRPMQEWRSGTRTRYFAVQLWASNEDAFEKLLARILSRGTAPSSERVQ